MPRPLVDLVAPVVDSIGERHAEPEKNCLPRNHSGDQSDSHQPVSQPVLRIYQRVSGGDDEQEHPRSDTQRRGEKCQRLQVARCVVGICLRLSGQP